MSSAPAPRNVLGLLGAFVVTSLVAGVLAAGLAVPAIGATGMASNNAVEAFDALPSELASTQVAANTTVLASDGSVIATFYDENRVPVSLDKMSPYLQNAIVAIEDERFYEHGGVDPQGLIRALVVNEIAGSVSQGASTLTQQLVKNMLKEQAYLAGDKAAYEAAEEQTKSRKIKEIRLAAALEKKMSKKEILAAYLNIAWFGGQVNGVEAASRYYFNTTAAKLTLPQAAMLAGMVQSPVQFNLADRDKLAAARNRRDTVLNKMYSQGMIDEETRDKAIKTKLRTKITPTYQGCANAGTSAYFCDYVYNLITKSNDFKALGKTKKARQAALKQGGYTIRTTLDPKLLRASWKAVKEAIPPNDSSNVATAAVTVEPGTGKVLSMIQDKYYSVDKGRKNTTINYSTDYKYGGSSGFLTGSTFKPVVLATWLKAGKSLNATIDGSPGAIAESSFKRCGSSLQSSATWNFVNSGDGGARGSMSVWDATANSINGAYIRMEQQLDLCDVADMAKAVGMHLAAPVAQQCGVKNTTKIPNCYPSVVLGIANQSPLTMANAYATFAASGKYCKPIVVTSIKNRNGKSLEVPTADCKQTVDSKVANTVTLGLSRALTNGTAARTGPLSNGQPASGKTGTTNDSQDTWFLGYTPQLSTAVWVGPETVNGQRKTMRGVRINGTYWSSVYGGSIAAPTWKKIMEAALEGKPVKEFPEADSSLTRTPTTNIPSVVGKSPDDARGILEDAGFQVSQSGDLETSDQPAGTVARVDPSGSASTGSTITIYLSAGPNTGDTEEGDDTVDAPTTGTTDPGNGNDTGGGGGQGNGR
ncbi:penicillin-binding protein [Kineosporia mesophila]|uniref:penicillin-binding protein n=1 Tax=Kineosporia mesophila TaxID=566012 RepID=UPI001E4CBDB9|nr:transglycosylase domain-containing protein [Kineosporia mesophila]MCD5350756.1 penicillin-binding protein [Kineosporia mesophila]